MIEIEVKVYAPFVQITKTEFLQICLPTGAQVRDLVTQLLADYPDLGGTAGVAYDPDIFMHDALLLKGETIVQLNDTLQNGDRVHMLPAIVSG